MLHSQNCVVNLPEGQKSPNFKTPVTTTKLINIIKDYGFKFIAKSIIVSIIHHVPGHMKTFT